MLPSIYYRERNQIRKELNELENVEVVNIWGHRDITLEEISARLRINGKGEIVLYGLSSDSFNYPNSVDIIEIGGFSFTSFSCNGGVGSGIDIGTKGELGHLFEMEFNSVKDVIDNYDIILETVSNFSTEGNYFGIEGMIEHYIFIHNEQSVDQDPIFILNRSFSLFEFAKTLEWNKNCRYAWMHKK
jgi:hypothetical protein